MFIQLENLLVNNYLKKRPVEADLVIGVPDSSISAAIGYAKAVTYSL